MFLRESGPPTTLRTCNVVLGDYKLLGPIFHLLICVAVACGEGGDIYGVADWLVTARVDQVPQCLLGVLDTSSLRISVSQEDQLLLLSCPQPPHTLPVQFDNSEAEVALVQHDDLILVRPIVHHMPQCEK